MRYARTMSKAAVVGSGRVGQILADGLLKHGYEVLRASRDPEKLADWKAGAGAKASVGNFADAARFADLIVLAVKGSIAELAIDLVGPDALAGKTVIDATNPIADAPAKDGVIAFFTQGTASESLMELLQKRAPKAHFVKAFSSVGAPMMVNPDYGGVRPSMFICGNDEGAKATVTALLDKFGWDTEDMGTATAARAIEPLCALWCIPGMRKNQWTHAFKLLKK